MTDQSPENLHPTASPGQPATDSGSGSAAGEHPSGPLASVVGAAPHWAQNRHGAPGKTVLMTIRTARPEEDLAGIASLYERGRLAGEWMDNDSGADIGHLQQAYFSDGPRSNFWIAQAEREGGMEIVGMVGVQQQQNHDAAAITRLRVSEHFRGQGIGRRLMEKALIFCQVNGYLKVVLEARVSMERAVSLFERFNFQFNRQRTVRGESILDFYLDLYREHDQQHRHNGLAQNP